MTSTLTQFGASLGDHAGNLRWLPMTPGEGFVAAQNAECCPQLHIAAVAAVLVGKSKSLPFFDRIYA